MSSSPYIVGIVVDPAFGDRLHAAAARMPLWIAETSVNRAAVEAYWRIHPGQPHTIGVTFFRVDPASQPADWAASVLGTVIEHHGEYSHDPPVSALEIIGAAPGEVLRNVLAEYGFTEVQVTPEGFLARM